MSFMGDIAWKALGAFYGKDRLHKSYGETAPEDWDKAFARLTQKQLREVMIKVRMGHPEWVPTLGQMERIINDYLKPPQRLSTYDPPVERDWLHRAGQMSLLVWIDKAPIVPRETLDLLVKEMGRRIEGYREIEKAGEVLNGKEIRETLWRAFDKILREQQ